MKRATLYSIGIIGTLSVAGILVSVFRKKAKEKKDQAFGKFIGDLESSTEPEKINEAVLNKAFNPTYWQEFSKKRAVISEKVAIEIAKQIAAAWNAGSFWDDLEEEVYRAFEDHRLKTFGDVSRVSFVYQSKSIANVDLWKHLSAKLSKKEFAKVKNIVIKKIG
tara:strand:+ start:995 stop:1486 length:492 start_codon:yes stop_codon:yes gene_type:complete